MMMANAARLLLNLSWRPESLEIDNLVALLPRQSQPGNPGLTHAREQRRGGSRGERAPMRQGAKY